jgi:hypothetical protein
MSNHSATKKSEKNPSDAESEAESGTDTKPTATSKIVKQSEKIARKAAADTQRLMDRLRAIEKTKDVPFTTAVLEVPKRKEDPKPAAKSSSSAASKDAKAPSVKAPSKKDKAEEERRERVAKAKKERDEIAKKCEATCSCYAFSDTYPINHTITLSGDEVVGKKGGTKELKLEIPVYGMHPHAIVPFEVVMPLILPDHKIDEQLLADAMKHFEDGDIVLFRTSKDPTNNSGRVGVRVEAWINDLYLHLLHMSTSQYHKVLTARGVKVLIPKLNALIRPSTSRHCQPPPAPKSKAKTTTTTDAPAPPTPAVAASSATTAAATAVSPAPSPVAVVPKPSAPTKKDTKASEPEPMKDGDADANDEGEGDGTADAETEADADAVVAEPDSKAEAAASPKTKVNGKRRRSDDDKVPTPVAEDDDDDAPVVTKRRKFAVPDDEDKETPKPVVAKAPAPKFDSPPGTPVPAAEPAPAAAAEEIFL